MNCHQLSGWGSGPLDSRPCGGSYNVATFPRTTVAFRFARVVLFGAVMASLAAAQVHVGEYDPADVQRGSLLFSTRCTTCHGNGGDQVPGVAVLSGRFRRAVSDEDLAGIIGNGLPGTGMPPGNYSAAELTSLVFDPADSRGAGHPRVAAKNGAQGDDGEEDLPVARRG